MDEPLVRGGPFRLTRLLGLHLPGARRRLAKACAAITAVEYSLGVPLSFCLARWGYKYAVLAVYGAFVLGNAAFQWHIVATFAEDPTCTVLQDETNDDDTHVFRDRHDTRETFLFCVPIGWLHMPNRWYDVLTMAPNWIAVMQAASLAGLWWDRWSADPALLAQAEASGEELMGRYLPQTLMVVVVASVLLHFLFALAALRRWVSVGMDNAASAFADSLSVHYIGRALRTRRHARTVGGHSGSNAFLAALVKGFKLVLKARLTALAWGASAATPGSRAWGILSCGVGVYALLPAAEHAASQAFCLLWASAALIFYAALALLILCGIFACDSHVANLAGIFPNGTCAPVQRP